MRRFFAPDIRENSLEALIKGDEFVHLKKVLRLKKGEKIALFNGLGLELLATIESVGRASASVTIDGMLEGRAESPLEITLVQGFIKGDKPELVIQKATELGVKKIVYYPAGRSVPAPGEPGLKNRLKRWDRVAVEAAKQCGRAFVPEISSSKSLKDAMGGASQGFRIVLFEEGGGPLEEALKKAPPKIDKIILLVGPEGGFSSEEIILAESGGFIPVGLGPRVLRAETAAIAAVSIVQYVLGDV
ncbi:MAG: 16S rRNA (uracil(1498)-N(3))-methyltransferase [Thermodesulfobacteriota bacterium]